MHRAMNGVSPIRNKEIFLVSRNIAGFVRYVEIYSSKGSRSSAGIAITALRRVIKQAPSAKAKYRMNEIFLSIV